MSSESDAVWFKPRHYIHFDWPIGPSSFSKVNSYVANADSVSSHSFYPLINYKIKSKKVGKDEHGKIVPKIKMRPISYASHMDSQIYSFYAHKLGMLYEGKLAETASKESILAFRKLGMSNVDFAKKAFSDITTMAPCSAIAIDITGFFDNLDHKVLKESWAKIIDQKVLPPDHYNIFKSLTKHCSVDREQLYKTLGVSKHNHKKQNLRICSAKDFRNLVRANKLLIKNPLNKGIPQGSPISALLSNIYMLDFDKAISNVISETGGKYYRYCDDMLFIVKPEFADGVEKQVQTLLKDLKLDAHPDKTETIHFQKNGERTYSVKKPLQYLGFTFDGERILIRSGSIARFKDRMKRGVYLAKATKRKRDKIKNQNGLALRPLFKTKLYEKYSHLGMRRNFIRYGLRASEKMQSKHMRRQLSKLWDSLQDEIKKK